MIGLVEYSKRHQICGHNGRSEGRRVWLRTWAAGGFAPEREEGKEPLAPVIFRWGFMGYV